MNGSLPLLPGFTFRDLAKSNYGYPRTLVYDRGVPISQPLGSSTPEKALEQLNAQNKVLDREKAAELIYGPKKEPQEVIKLPRYLAMDKKVLRFDGWFREDTDDYCKGTYRIRRVKVLYYLQNDTMEVIEPKTPNSGLLQGTLFKRHAFPHPNGKGRCYLWKDLNLGINIFVYGNVIRLVDCDQWTREYLIDAGIELNDTEAMPPDPYEMQKEQMETRKEEHQENLQKKHKLKQFFAYDRKVLRFYGIWKDILSDPPDVRKVVLLYYLVDDSLELLEDHAPNDGRMPNKTIIKKQKVPKDRDVLTESFPRVYQEIKDEDNVNWYRAKDFRTGEDFVFFEKKVFLYDCDEFTRHFYKTRFNTDLETIAVLKKPKPQTYRVIPPHTGIGNWDDSIQNCFSLIPKPQKKNFTKEMVFDGIILRYKGVMISPIPLDKYRKFVLSFFPCDDTVCIHEEVIPNSGFPGGSFLKRIRLMKPEGDRNSNPVYYEAKDFYIGAKIHACGKIFHLTDADRFVLGFMEQHPEIYTEEQIQRQKQNTIEDKMKSESMKIDKCKLMQSMREEVLKRYGAVPYPIPNCLEPANDLQFRAILDEELYCADLPIPTDYLNKVVDMCTDDNNRTDMNEVRNILLPVLGHDIRKDAK